MATEVCSLPPAAASVVTSMMESFLLVNAGLGQASAPLMGGVAGAGGPIRVPTCNGNFALTHSSAARMLYPRQICHQLWQWEISGHTVGSREER